MNKPTKLKLGEEARKAILKGTNMVYDAVRLTLGPQGGNALLYRTFNRGPRITNDGVTISEVIEPKDEFEALAANAYKESAKRTNEKAGDGTTTTIVLAGVLINKIFSKLSNSSAIKSKLSKDENGVMAIKSQILSEAEKIKTEIGKRAKKVETIEDLEKIATVSVEDAELGKVIAKMVWDVGIDGYVDVLEGHKGTIETEVIRGMRFPAKIAAKAFVNNPSRYEMVANDIPVIVTNYALDNAMQINAFTLML